MNTFLLLISLGYLFQVIATIYFFKQLERKYTDIMLSLFELKKNNIKQVKEKEEKKLPGANRNPRTEEQKKMLAEKKKEWWKKKKEEAAQIAPPNIV